MPNLIYCAACEKACSDRVDRCIHCGHPLSAAAERPAVPAAPAQAAAAPAQAAAAAQPSTQTIQQTSKVWKLLMLIGGMLTIGGITGCILGASIQSGGFAAISSVAAFLGAGLSIVAKLCAWWFHG